MSLVHEIAANGPSHGMLIIACGLTPVSACLAMLRRQRLKPRKHAARTTARTRRS